MATATLQYATPHVNKQAEETLQRAARAMDVQPQPHVTSRLAQAAQSLTAVGLAAASAELCNSALMACVRLCYQVDTDGRYANIDTVDGRLLRPAPWGSAGHKVWGLRRRESDILRACLLSRLTPRQGQPLPLFVFDAGKWFVNLADYATETAAQAYVKQWGVSAREYKRHLEGARQADRRRTGSV